MELTKELTEAVNAASDMLVSCFENGGKLLVCGNGGSASDSAHITGEFVKAFVKKRPIPETIHQAVGDANLQMGLPCIDLTAQGALIAAVINDLGGECVFAQQVMAYGKPGDVIIGISTSGNSKNVVLAMQTAKALGMKTIGMTGKTGGKMKGISDVWIGAPETETYKIQEVHLPVYHQICLQVEDRMFAE